MIRVGDSYEGLLVPKRFDGADYQGDTLEIAQRLLGCLFVRQWNGSRLSGIIVETEAYLATGDPASHSFNGQKRRNLAMYQAPGTLYVYAIHAKYCLNVVTEPCRSGSRRPYSRSATVGRY